MPAFGWKRVRGARAVPFGPASRSAWQSPARTYRSGEPLADSRQHLHTPGLTRFGRDDPHCPTFTDRALHLGQHPLFFTAASIADSAGPDAGSARNDAVDDHFRNVDAAGLERPKTVSTLSDRQLLGQHDPGERGPRGRPEQLTDVVRLSTQERDETIGRFGAMDAGELFANQPMILLQVIERGRDSANRFRRSKQTKHVAGWRGVHHDHIIFCGSRRSAARKSDDLQQPDQFVDAWHRQSEQRLHVVPIEPGAVLDDVADGLTMLAEPPVERPGVHRARPPEASGVSAARRHPSRATDSRTSSASPSECAGSVEITSTRCPDCAA